MICTLIYTGEKMILEERRNSWIASTTSEGKERKKNVYKVTSLIIDGTQRFLSS